MTHAFKNPYLLYIGWCPQLVWGEVEEPMLGCMAAVRHPCILYPKELPPPPPPPRGAPSVVHLVIYVCNFDKSTARVWNLRDFTISFHTLQTSWFTRDTPDFGAKSHFIIITFPRFLQLMTKQKLDSSPASGLSAALVMSPGYNEPNNQSLQYTSGFSLSGKPLNFSRRDSQW